MKKLSYVVLLGISASLVGCGGVSLSESGLKDTKWATACGTTGKEIKEVAFGDKTVTVTAKVFEKKGCKKLTSTSSYTYDFKIGEGKGKTSVSKGVGVSEDHFDIKEFDLTLKSATLVLTEDSTDLATLGLKADEQADVLADIKKGGLISTTVGNAHKDGFSFILGGASSLGTDEKGDKIKAAAGQQTFGLISLIDETETPELRFSSSFTPSASDRSHILGTSNFVQQK